MTLLARLRARFPLSRGDVALSKAVADNMRSAGLLWWKLQGADDGKANDQQHVAPHGDFMRSLVPGLVLIAVALSCAACGESPTVLTAFRTEEQAQTHCPKDIVVWLAPQRS
jgi:hypothetical protein